MLRKFQQTSWNGRTESVGPNETKILKLQVSPGSSSVASLVRIALSINHFSLNPYKNMENIWVKYQRQSTTDFPIESPFRNLCVFLCKANCL